MVIVNLDVADIKVPNIILTQHELFMVFVAKLNFNFKIKFYNEL